MHKCLNCNTEFEGKFCPECGTQWQEEKTCPQCGTTLAGNAKFCTECGYSFLQRTESSAPQTMQQTTENAVNSDAAESNAKTAKVHFFTEKRKSLIFKILGYVPAALIVLFSLLLFAFYAAPVAVAVLGGETLFGEDLGNESLGNVYQMVGYSEIPSLQGGMIALIVCAVLSLAFGVAIAVSVFHPKLNLRQITLFQKIRLKLTDLFTYCGYLFYFTYLIVGCVVIGQVNAADEGTGTFAAGACPILLIVFTILFALLSAGAISGRFFITKKNPTYAEKEREKTEIWNRGCLEKIAAEQAAIKASLVAPVPPEPPVKVRKPKKKSIPKPQGLLKEVIALRRMKRLILSFCFFILPIVALMPGTKYVKKWNYKQAREKWSMILAIVFSVCAMAIVLGFVSWLTVDSVQRDIRSCEENIRECEEDIQRYEENIQECEESISYYQEEIQSLEVEIQSCEKHIQSLEEGNQEDEFTIQYYQYKIDDCQYRIQDYQDRIQDCRDSIQNYRDLIQYNQSDLQDYEYELQDSGGRFIMLLEFPLSLLTLALYYLGIFIAALVAIRRQNKLCMEFYGTKSPKKDTTPIFDFDKLNYYYLNYLQAKKKYRDYSRARNKYKIDKAIYDYCDKRYKCEKPYDKKPPRAYFWARAHKVLVSVIASLLVVAIVLSIALPVALPPILHDKMFDADTVRGIYVGADYTYVEEKLGEPDRKTDTVWTYYSSNCRAKFKKLESLEEELKEREDFEEIGRLTEEIDELTKELNETVYKSITVRFAKNEYDSYAVYEIRLDTAVNSDSKKETKKVSIIYGGRIHTHVFKDDRLTEIYYTDGSYARYYIPESAFSSVDTDTKGEYEISWSDSWGTYYETVYVQ